MNKNYVISIDLGGTNVRVGIIDNDLNIIEVLREETNKDGKEHLSQQIIRMISSLHYQKYNIKKVGISACGLTKNNHIQLLPNLMYSDYDLKGDIEKIFPNFTVLIQNDANCTAFAEARYGASKDVDNSFFITISTGIGGALIINKSIVDLPFEIGHEFIEYKSQPIEREKILSGNGLVYLCNDNKLPIQKASDFFLLCEYKNELALEILNYWKQRISQFLANIQLLYNCDTIILSGGVMKSSHLFINDLISISNEYLKPFPVKKVNIKLAQFDQNAGLIGGACVALEM